MSQPRNPADSQALLQSMLQRLKLQPGREGQANLHPPVPIPTGSTWKQDGEQGAYNLNNSSLNGFEFSTNGTTSKELRISAAATNISLKGGEIQKPGFGCEVDKGLVSFPTQKNNTDSVTSENRVLQQATQSGITPTGTEQLFPAKSFKDADASSSEKNDRVSFVSPAITSNTSSIKDAVQSMGQNQDQDQGFTPKVYMWSLKPTNVHFDGGSDVDKGLHMGNGGFGSLAQSKDMQIVPSEQITTNSLLRRKQRTSENKTRRWTQKIKERWRDRAGSFSKKGKEEEQKEVQKSEKGIEILPQNQILTAETLVSTSNQKEEKSLSSLDSSDLSTTSPTHTEDSNNEGCMRSTSDFEFGLGSFSLLEEIVTGQEWAKFLNPNQSTASANQRPSEDFKIPSSLHDSTQSSLILNRGGGVSNKWSSGTTEAASISDFRMAQMSLDAFPPVSMDVSDGKGQRYDHREADQSEPMEHGHISSDMRSGNSGLGRQRRPPSIVQPADILKNSVLKSRVHLNRKRQHQSAERGDETFQKVADRDVSEGSTSSLSQTRSHETEMTGELHRDNVMPSNIPNSPPPPLFPSPFNPFACAPKGVLKHSISKDSETSVEVVTKRRRVEENRRVHFSEDVVTIMPPELDLDATDSEEDSQAEEDSVTEQECEVEQPMVEEVAPARRPALPAWILALKRRNTGRKHR